MGSYKHFGEGSQMNGAVEKPEYPIDRQSSILGLTFDELQSTFSGLGKDFGSMNMDELLKSIWSAEETQNVSLIGGGGGEGGSAANGALQKQGSLTLPRTVSQKKVDDVWRDLFVENVVQKDVTSGERMRSLERRQQTLGEITLEEFLLRAGVVREDNPKVSEKMNNNVFFGGDASPHNSNTSSGVALNFQQPGHNIGVQANRFAENVSSTDLRVIRSSGYASNSATVKPSRQVQVKPQTHLPIFPKQTNLSITSPPRPLGNNDLPINSNGMELGGMMGFRGVSGNIPISPALAKNLASDMMGQNNIDSSPLSSSPYAYDVTRGRKGTATLEKAIERRTRRMIKNRESAARSRARKQAYTTELEEEIAKLKEVNETLQKKQAEIIEMQKNQMVEKVRQQWGGKRICLTRTLTGPW